MAVARAGHGHGHGMAMALALAMAMAMAMAIAMDDSSMLLFTIVCGIEVSCEDIGRS